MKAPTTLICTVRNCRQPLAQQDRRLTCKNHHSFDIARSGYINLLQPQDRRSKHPGDTREAVLARRSIHDLGITKPIFQAIAEAAGPIVEGPVLDVGSGDGYYLGSLSKATTGLAVGIDISISAVDAAARRYPDCVWIVANADRFIPHVDHSFSHILSITGRLNPEEFHRVLQPEGKVLVGVPAPDDLLELRGQGHDRVARTREVFSSKFKLAGYQRVTTNAFLDEKSIERILLSIYRPIQSKPPEAGTLTFSLDLLLFTPLS